jgi:hypothetical protein
MTGRYPTRGEKNMREAVILGRDECAGRAWAAREGKRPAEVNGLFFWNFGISGPSGLPMSVAGIIARDRCLGKYPTEAAAYAALGRAVRAVHAAVPPLAPESPA